jgi:hypothetical protein
LSCIRWLNPGIFAPRHKLDPSYNRFSPSTMYIGRASAVGTARAVRKAKAAGKARKVRAVRTAEIVKIVRAAKQA